MSAPRLVLVEGESDRIAIEVLARRTGRDLAAEGVVISVMDGATNIRRHLRELLEGRGGWGITGLYDRAEQRFVARALGDLGRGPIADHHDLERLGFFACVDDLEDELIRAVGERRVLEVLEAQGDLASFRRLQHQPVQRSWTQDRQLHRFISARSGYKARYAGLLAEEVPLDGLPRPLALLLAAA